MTYYKVIEKDDISLHLIDLPQKISGFSNFLAAWLIKDRRRDRTILIDCGPSSSIPSLLEDLANLEARPDHLLLSHIHLDHGGGAGDLLVEYPSMEITAHGRGAKHLVNPSRLWEESLAVLGSTAEAYGKPSPIPESSLAKAPDGITEIDTPGHASHHLTFYTELERTRTMFSGEALGVCIEDMAHTWTNKTEEEDMLYVRPATAPPFRYETTLSSIKKLSMIDCDLICPGHYGPVHSTNLVLDKAERQLRLWRKLIDPLYESGKRDAKELVEMLIMNDPYLNCFNKFTEEVKARERSFLENSVKGFINELELKASEGE